VNLPEDTDWGKHEEALVVRMETFSDSDRPSSEGVAPTAQSAALTPRQQ
jgi:hypothetical protein